MSRIYTICIYDKNDVLIKTCCTYNSIEICKKFLANNHPYAEKAIIFGTEQDGSCSAWDAKKIKGKRWEHRKGFHKLPVRQ